MDSSANCHSDGPRILASACSGLMKLIPSWPAVGMITKSSYGSQGTLSPSGSFPSTDLPSKPWLGALTITRSLSLEQVQLLWLLTSSPAAWDCACAFGQHHSAINCLLASAQHGVGIQRIISSVASVDTLRVMLAISSADNLFGCAPGTRDKRIR